jgi:glycogen synthase
MQRNAMRHPTGWDASAARYRSLYEQLAGSSTAAPAG